MKISIKPKKILSFFKRKLVLYPLIAVLVVLALYLTRSLFVAAWVNLRPISRVKLVKELERQGGSQVLSGLIDESLVMQEAKKAKVSVNQTEVDKEVTNLENVLKAQGLTIEQALEFRNQKKSDLLRQIKFQLMVQKLLSSKIILSETDIRDYFNNNKSLFGQNPVYDKVKEEVKSQLFQTKLSEEYTTWIAELRSKAKINYFVSF